MIKLKRLISFFLSIVVIIAVVLNFNQIKERIIDLANFSRKIEIKPPNEYYKDEEFLFVQQVDSYVPNNYNDLVNIFYSVLNQGWDDFTFYCADEYEKCLDDVYKISYDRVLLSDINNFVHPYNSYSTIRTLYDDTGEVTIKVKHLYTDEEINQIDADIDKIINENTNEQMSTRDKILAVHDYIINNTKYDQVKADGKESGYDSSRIQGVLYDKYSVCSGYTDIMAVVLDKLDVPNFKVSSETHIWNAVYMDNAWRHLDLTWDDPIGLGGKDNLDHTYFLISSDRLYKVDKDLEEHIFDTNVYLELK